MSPPQSFLCNLGATLSRNLPVSLLLTCFTDSFPPSPWMSQLTQLASAAKDLTLRLVTQAQGTEGSVHHSLRAPWPPGPLPKSESDLGHFWPTDILHDPSLAQRGQGTRDPNDPNEITRGVESTGTSLDGPLCEFQAAERKRPKRAQRTGARKLLTTVQAKGRGTTESSVTRGDLGQQMMHSQFPLSGPKRQCH